MTNTLLIVAAATITFASRAFFLVKSVNSDKVRDSAFLDAFPLALFMVIATVGLAAPEGSIGITPALWAGLGGAAAGYLFKKSILAVVIVGFAVYWLVRVLT